MNCHKLLVGIVAVLALLVSFPANVWADDASLGAVGSSVEPLQNDQVEMTAERIEAVIEGDQASVTCVFTFTNTGGASTVLMGFPQMAPRMLGGDPELLDFTADVDGTALPVSYRKQAPPPSEGEGYDGWHTFEVPFAAGQTRTVRNTYHGRLTYISDGSLAFAYVLHTGATWKGPIGTADIIVRWPNVNEVRAGTINGIPQGFNRTSNEISWHFTNLEPTVDNDVLVYFTPTSAPAPPVTPGMPTTGSQQHTVMLALLMGAVMVILGMWLRSRLGLAN